MARNTAGQLFLSGFVESTSQRTNKLDAFNRTRRRLQRSTSAPATPLITNSIPPPESIIIHAQILGRRLCSWLTTLA
ncbi:hypothetical protein CUMW_106310 [Citrus unshiu]|nr:hypothetical protein CUMW_106310 [Citrus unshiu]